MQILSNNTRQLIHANQVSLFFLTVKPNTNYCNDVKFSDRPVWTKNTDPDQTAPTLFAIPSASFGYITIGTNFIFVDFIDV